MNSIAKARKTLLAQNKKASTAALIANGFALKQKVAAFAKSFELWARADGRQVKLSAKQNYLLPALPAKSRKTRTTYSLQEPVVLGSRLRRVVGDMGFTAAFDRHEKLWHVANEAGKVFHLTVDQLTTLSGAKVRSMASSAAA